MNPSSVERSVQAARISPLPGPKLGLFCSVQCPGGIILKLYEAIRALRGAGVVIVGGFHSPMERECLELLLRGTQPVVLCLARARMTLPTAWKTPIADGRLFVLTPEDATRARMNAALAERRNQQVAALADALVAYASPGSKTERLALEALRPGNPSSPSTILRALTSSASVPLRSRRALSIRLSLVC